MKKASQLSTTILTIFIVLAIGLDDGERNSGKTTSCIKVLTNASHVSKGASTSDSKLCTSLCEKISPQGVSFCKPIATTGQSKKGNPVCNCRYWCRSDGTPHTT
ncbi:putative defensin-like protein 152 [Arabidopsis thaliana]